MVVFRDRRRRPPVAAREGEGVRLSGESVPSRSARPSPPHRLPAPNRSRARSALSPLPRRSDRTLGPAPQPCYWTAPARPRLPQHSLVRGNNSPVHPRVAAAALPPPIGAPVWGNPAHLGSHCGAAHLERPLLVFLAGDSGSVATGFQASHWLVSPSISLSPTSPPELELQATCSNPGKTALKGRETGCLGGNAESPRVGSSEINSESKQIQIDASPRIPGAGRNISFLTLHCNTSAHPEPLWPCQLLVCQQTETFL